LLRTAFDKLLPRQIWERRKMGFGVPLAVWFRRELRDLTSSRLLGIEARCHAYFRPEVIERLVDEHVSGRSNHAYRLWNLLMLESWLRTWAQP
jgi:asparagine synthase (glutamine-hydrolysing)